MSEPLTIALNAKPIEGNVEISFPTEDGSSILLTRAAAERTIVVIQKAIEKAAGHTDLYQRGTGAGLRQPK